MYDQKTWVGFVRVGDPAQPRRLGAVAVFQVEHGVRIGEGAASLGEFSRRPLESLEPSVRDDAFGENVAPLEVRLALRLGKHASRITQNLLRGHRVISAVTVQNMLCPVGTGHNPRALSQRRELNGIMKIVGYSDRLSVQPGQVIRFMVSCVAPAIGRISCA